MGLLDDISDNFSSMDPNQQSAMNRGLLAMGLNMLATPGKLGQQLGAGGLAGLGAYQGALDQQKKDALSGMQKQMLQMQLDQQQRAAAKQQQLDALPGQFYKSPAQQALANGGGPTVGNAERMDAAQPQFDSQGYGKALMQFDPVAGLAWQQSIAKEQPKPVLVSDGQTLVDPTTGRPVYSSQPKPMAVSDGQTVIDPATGRPIYTSAPKPMTVGEGQSVFNPATGRVMFSGQSRPVALGESQSLVDPRTGKVVYAPPKDDSGDGNDIESQAQLIANYKLPAPTGAAALNPNNAKVLQRVSQINPGYDASQYAARVKAQRDFTTGPLGNSLRSVSTANAHLDQLNELAAEMTKGSIPGVNRIVNWYKAQTGDPAVTNFNAIKNVVGQEVVKAIVAGGGGVGEREEAAKAFENASSPAQIQGVIAHYRAVMQAQADNLLAQRRAAGLNDDTLPDYSGRGGKGGVNPASLPKPMAGMVMDGYKLKVGGNPADPKAWVVTR